MIDRAASGPGARQDYVSSMNPAPTRSWRARERELGPVLDLQARRGQELFGFARRLGLDDDEATDAVQEAVVRLWQQLDRGIAIENADAWTFTTVYRIAMDQHRLRRRVAGLTPRLFARSQAAAPPDATDRIAVWTEIDRLPETARAVIYLHYRADLPFDQVATALGITPGNARTIASRAITTLRGRLADEGAHQ
jgi:RNA polymerase sigma factor (sigma-70 family)